MHQIACLSLINFNRQDPRLLSNRADLGMGVVYILAKVWRERAGPSACVEVPRQNICLQS